MPRPGEHVRFPTGRHANVLLKVHKVEKSLVWCVYPGGDIMPFIGFFEREQAFNSIAEIVEDTPP